MEHYLLIDIDGSISMIYDDQHIDLLEEGKAIISRVSNVEPGIDGLWYAYIINGPIIGGFKLRQDALDAEIEYIHEQLLGKG